MTRRAAQKCGDTNRDAGRGSDGQPFIVAPHGGRRWATPNLGRDTKFHSLCPPAEYAKSPHAEGDSAWQFHAELATQRLAIQGYDWALSS